jgi:hypothetical protein
MVANNSQPRGKLFSLGEVVATPAALAALTRSGESPATFIHRHAAGDWGEVCDHDRGANEWALANDGRLLSVYTTKQGEKLWIITEADRSVTTVLLPEDY